MMPRCLDSVEKKSRAEAQSTLRINSTTLPVDMYPPERDLRTSFSIFSAISAAQRKVFIIPISETRVAVREVNRIIINN